VAESSREEALRTCVAWSLGWVCVWWVWSFVEILQGVLLDICVYCGFCRSCRLGRVLNEWEDIIEYPIDLEVRRIPLLHWPGSCIVSCSCFQVVSLGPVPGQ